MFRLGYSKGRSLHFRFTRSYFDFKDGKWHEEPRHEPPKPHNDFHAAYISKPLYWNPKGRPEVFREKNHIALGMATISVACMAAGVGWLYYREHVQGYKALYAKYNDWASKFNPQKNVETTEVVRMHKEMQRLGLMEYFRSLSSAGDIELERDKIDSLDHDINEPNKVNIRAETGRDIRAWDMAKLDEYLRKNDPKYAEAIVKLPKT